MGVDAKILVRKVPARIVTDEWLKAKSWALVRSIGHEHFSISDGLPPPEYEKANDAWHAAFKDHPLYPQWNALERPSDFRQPDRNREARDAIHKQILSDLPKPRKERRLAIDRVLVRYREDDDPPPGTLYRQYGDDVPAQDEECLLEVSLAGRYYGEGYERGDILSYCSIAEWLEQNIPGCEVWYGGDSSGVCVEPFTDQRRRELRALLYSDRGRAYYEGFWKGVGESPCRPPACSLCPGGNYCGNQHGSGQNYAAFRCAGCGETTETRDNGKTWNRPEGR